MVQYAENGSEILQFELGQMFQYGNVKYRDYQQAAKWYKLSAKQGYRKSQHLLAAMYAQGRGVARDYIKAYAWCKVSAKQNSRRAALKIKKIEARMSTIQIAIARELSNRYYETYVAN